jgi:O-antigen/teichoic acid export membrane protein
MLGRLAPAGDFAAYGASQNIGGRIAGLSVAIMGPIFHNTTRGVGGDQSKKPSEVYRESFDFMFPWYSLLITGVFFWSGPITALWLGHKYGPAVGQAFPWVVAGLSLTAIANISGAQLGGLNRVGTGLILQILSGLLSAVTVVIGWHLGGLAGASAGFFAAKLIYVIQDFLVRRWVGLGAGEYLVNARVILRQIAVVGGIWIIFRIFLPHAVSVQCAGAILSALAGGALEVFILIKEIQARKTGVS